MLFETSFYTHAEIKAVKSTTAYKNFLIGWVKEAWFKAYNDRLLVLASVSISSLNANQKIKHFIHNKYNHVSGTALTKLQREEP